MPWIDVGWTADTAQADKATLVALSFRQLGRYDLPDVEQHLLGLDLTDRRARFGGAFSDAAIAGYVRRINPDRAVLMAAVDTPSGRIFGLAEAQPASVPGWVEMAVSVHASYRRRGLGRGLVGATLALAFARGAEAAEFLFDRSNRPIVGLVQALGARIDASLKRAEVRRTQPFTQSRVA